MTNSKTQLVWEDTHMHSHCVLRGEKSCILVSSKKKLNQMTTSEQFISLCVSETILTNKLVIQLFIKSRK